MKSERLVLGKDKGGCIDLTLLADLRRLAGETLPLRQGRTRAAGPDNLVCIGHNCNSNKNS